MKHAIPPGFKRCPKCGEFNGSTHAKYLNSDTEPPRRVGRRVISEAHRNWLRELKAEYERDRDPEREVRVSCLCKGIPCRRCGVNLVHRPISNSYDEKSNTVGHWFYLAGLMPCAECRRSEAER